MEQGLSGGRESTFARGHPAPSHEWGSRKYSPGERTAQAVGGGAGTAQPALEKNAARTGAGSGVGRMIRPTAAEKLEIIRLVEESELPVKQTLEELDVPRSTFYRWYQRYQMAGLAGLEEEPTAPHQFWNRIPDSVRDRVVHLALAYPEKSSRQLAWFITDSEGYFISESSVYRILKGFDLITSPAFTLVKASDRFKNPT